jgi:hypothetical protein
VLDGLLNFLIAYKAEDGEYWTSDKSGALYSLGWRNVGSPHFYADGVTFTSHEGGSIRRDFLKATIVLDSFNFGIMIPHLFSDGRNRQDTAVYQYDEYGEPFANWQTYGNTARPRYGSGGPSDRRNGLVEHAVKNSVVGLKFSQSPIEIAAQFKVKDAGAYFGAKFSVTDAVSLGLSFMGILNPAAETDNVRFRFGGQFDFNGGDFGANVQGWYLRQYDGDKGENYAQTIAIEPSFFYKIIPSHLGFRLNAGFYFDSYNLDGEDVTADYYNVPIVWALQPMLFWNFRGNGAFVNNNDGNGYNWGGTSMLVRYKIVNGSVSNTVTTAKGTVNQPGNNALDILFNWGF